MNRGDVPRDAGLTAVQFGWEIAGTHGPETFSLHDYNLVGIQGQRRRERTAARWRGRGRLIVPGGR